MARITIASLQAEIAALKEQLAERDARLELAREEYRKVRAGSRALEFALAQARAAKPAAPAPAPVVTRFVRAGQTVEKTRIGNRSIERVLSDVAPAGAVGHALVAAMEGARA